MAKTAPAMSISLADLQTLLTRMDAERLTLDLPHDHDADDDDDHDDVDSLCWCESCRSPSEVIVGYWIGETLPPHAVRSAYVECSATYSWCGIMMGFARRWERAPEETAGLVRDWAAHIAGSAVDRDNNPFEVFRMHLQHAYLEESVEMIMMEQRVVTALRHVFAWFREHVEQGRGTRQCTSSVRAVVRLAADALA
jgi:hypothetical protein